MTNSTKKQLKDTDPTIVEWLRSEKNDNTTSLIYRFPTRGVSLKRKHYFNVKANESAIFFKHGEMIGDFSGGTYSIEKSARRKGTEIIWFDLSLLDIPWGIPETLGIRSKEGYVFGLHGHMKLRISNVKIFYHYVIGGNQEWTLSQLKEWVKNVLYSSLKGVLQQYNLENLCRELDEPLKNHLIATLGEEFNLYGLELTTFNVLGIKTPECADFLFKLQSQIALIHTDLDQKGRSPLPNYENLIENRIKSLQQRLHDLQDQFIDGLLLNEEFQHKSQLINHLIMKSVQELHGLKHESTMNLKK